MAIFHATLKHGSRKDGRLGGDKFDYINRLGRFANRHDGRLGYAESGNMPAWASDSRDFWIAADAGERSNGNIYHELEFALPRELTKEQQIFAAREYAQAICGDKHPYSLGLHDKEGNPHVHLMWSGRQLDDVERPAEKFFKRYNPKHSELGGCLKADIAGDNWLVDRRRDWQDIANRHLAAAGLDDRIDHRSHKDRGLDEAPGVHLGRHATRLEMRGKNTWRGLKNREVQHLNASLLEVRSKIQQKEKPNGKTKLSQRRAHSEPKRAFTVWRDRAEDRQGLRTSRHAGPERMPVLRQPRAGDGQQEARDVVLQRAIPGSGGRDHGMHGLRAGGLYCVESLDRRQQYKRQILTKHYHAQVSDQLASRLLYIDRQPDQVVIALRGYAGAVGGRVIDKGDRLTCGRRGTDTEVMAMMDLAKAKGFRQIHITGTEFFKARAYIEAVRAGLAVVGYEPSPELRAQIEKEKIMLGQAGAGGMMALTPDVTAGQVSSASRWLDPLRAAREKLEAERREAKEKLAILQETNLDKLGMELAATYGGTQYSEALRDFKAAAAAAKEAGAFTRKRAEAKKEQAWQAFQQAYARALAVPAAAQRFAEATMQNQEHERLTATAFARQFGIGEIQYFEQEIAKGRNPEPEFSKVWKSRKLNPLKPWQELALSPVFEADAAQKLAHLQAEADATDLVKQVLRQEQIQREVAAQQQADSIQDQLGKPGLTNEQEETLEQQHRYFLALADGHDEEEAKERAAKKSNAPRP